MHFLLFAFIFIGIPILTIDTDTTDSQNTTTSSFNYHRYTMPSYNFDFEELPTLTITDPSYYRIPLQTNPTLNPENIADKIVTTIDAAPSATEESISTGEQETENQDDLQSNFDSGGVVYVTNTGNAYHVRDCGHLRSVNSISLREATIRGYWPCTVCNPPIYTGDLPEITEPERPHPSGGGSGSGTGSSSSGHGSYTGYGNGGGSGSGSDSNHTSTQPTSTNTTEATIHIETTVKQNPAEDKVHVVETIIICIVCSPMILCMVAPIFIWCWKQISSMINSVKHMRKQNKEDEILLAKIEQSRIELTKALTSLSEKLIAAHNATPSWHSLIQTNIENQELELQKELHKHNAFLNEDNLICSKVGKPPYGLDCTVVYSPYGSCYHRADCTARGMFYGCSHISKPPKSLHPCSKCLGKKSKSAWAIDCTKRVRKIKKSEKFRDFIALSTNNPPAQKAYICRVQSLLSRIERPIHIVRKRKFPFKNKKYVIPANLKNIENTKGENEK
jgi:hypothetical protein